MFQFSQLPNQMFDARTIDPSPFPVLPLADYKVVITTSEPKENNAKNGGYLEFTLQIIEGQFNNTVVPYRLNLFHSDQRTVDIAYRQLSALAHVTGKLQLRTSSDLHNIPFIATIGPQKPPNDNFMNVYTVKDLQGNIPGKGSSAAIASTPQPQPPAPMPPSGYPPQPQGYSPQPAASAGWPPAAPQAPAAPATLGWGPPTAPLPSGAPPWATPAAQPANAAPPATPPWQPGPPAAPAVPSWPPR